MSHTRGGGRQDGTDRQIVDVECPKCGCPNRPDDTHCIYCRVSLIHPEHSVRAYMQAYANYIKRIALTLKWRASSGRMKAMGNGILTLAVSLFLIVAGVAFILSGTESGEALSWVLGALFLIYGVSASLKMFAAIKKSGG